MSEMPGLSDRIEHLRARIAVAAAESGRDPESVRLIAVTKTHPSATASAAVAAGLTDLGENRPAELVAKATLVAARWHLIGQLQRNKVRDVVGVATLIHSVDRSPLVDAIARRAEELGLVQDVLVQVNVADDPAKSGCSLAELDALVTYASDRPSVRVVGLMTVPPLPAAGSDPVGEARRWFERLRTARDRLRAVDPRVNELSMGMSDDVEAAVREGATMVRVGSALFGERATTEESR